MRMALGRFFPKTMTMVSAALAVSVAAPAWANSASSSASAADVTKPVEEAQEEALADIEIDRLLAVYSVPRIGQVQVMFRARLLGDYGVGPESQEVKLVDWKDIPWSELAFPTVVWALTQYAETRHLADFPPFANPDGADPVIR